VIVADVQDEMRPAARAALAKGLTYHQAQRAFLLTLLDETLKLTKQRTQQEAAELLKISRSMISTLVTRGPAAVKKSGRQWQEKDLSKVEL
jgi:predicted XRE-type DNA-binding protein